MEHPRALVFSLPFLTSLRLSPARGRTTFVSLGDVLGDGLGVALGAALH